ncbi:MAG: hypothetical protein LBQ77_04315 [Treponema sp.]|jgi:hypothetical protein|nr:hypothetical protein [Treponema sp.]
MKTFVDKVALNNAISTAQADHDSVVSQAVKDAYQSAINAARAVLNDAQATQTAADSALSVLNTATATFTAAKESGSKTIITLSGTITATCGDSLDAFVNTIVVCAGNTPLGQRYLRSVNSNTTAWSVEVPAVTEATELTFKVTIRDGNNSYYQDIDAIPDQPVILTPTDKVIPDINLTAAVTFVTLSGTLDASINDETIDTVVITASTGIYDIGSIEYNSVSTPNSMEWELSVPSSPTDRTVRFEIMLNTGSGKHYRANVATVTVPAGQNKNDIALTARGLTVSGTFGTVSLDGNPPSMIYLDAYYVDGLTYAGGWSWSFTNNGAYTDNLAWSLPILTSGSSITLSYTVQIRDENSRGPTYVLPTTTDVSTSNVSDIQLGDAIKTTKTVTGTIVGLTTAKINILSRSMNRFSDLALSDILAYSRMSDGNTVSFKIDEAIDSFYLLITDSSEMVYRISDLIDISGQNRSFSLNWATMTPVQTNF